MVISCCAVGCTNRQGYKPNLAFYRIPIAGERRRLWIAAINRKDWQPSQYSRLCSEHFLQGHKSDEPFSPDYVPSVFPHTKNRRKRKKRQPSLRCKAASAVHNLSTEMTGTGQVFVETGEDTGTEASICDTGVNSDCEVMCKADLTSEHIGSFQRECQLLWDEKFAKKEKLSSHLLDQRRLEKKLNTLTGLHNYQVFMALLDLVKPALKDTAHLTSFQQLLLTLMRLRINLPVSFLSHLFGVHSATISRVFTNVINVLNEILVPVSVLWPKREHIQTFMPMCFSKSFKHCMSVIDCFEIAMEKPKDLMARAQTYSRYRSHNTMKYLIGITPQGVISFISKGWGGRTTDAHITVNSGFLDNLLPGDLILADHGFTIQNQVGLYCAKVETPAFTWGKKQLGAVELENTQKLSAVRLHVERIIGQVRSKYKMLHGPVPISLFMKSTDEAEYTTLDKIVRVACALTNLCPSVVPVD